MELRDLTNILIRRLWLLIAGTVLAVTLSYCALRFLAPWPRYQATATVLIGSNSELDWAVLQMGRDLAPTYVEWAQHRPVLQSVIDALNLPWSVEGLRGRIDVRAIRDTQLMEISATSTDPETAATIANEVAWQLTRQPLPIARGEDATQLSLEGNVSVLKRRIEASEMELADLSNRLAAAASEEEVEALTQHIEVVQRNLDVWRKSYAELDTVSTHYLDSFIAVAEEAIPPAQPLTPWINVFVAGITGLVLATGLAFLLEHLDNTIKTNADVVEHLSVPALGVATPLIGPDPGLLRRLVRRLFAKKAGASKLPLTDLPTVPNSYRRLMARIARAKEGPLQGIILVTSPDSEDGQGMAALGLALASAETGRRTILVDASLRRPVLHTWLNLPNEVGWTSLLDVNGDSRGPDLSQLLHPLGRGDLEVVTSGSLNTVSPELFLSPRLQASLNELTTQADLVLLSGPPVLFGPEAAILASKVNYILLVLDVRRTRVEEAQEAVDVLTTADSTSVGIVLNSSQSKGILNGLSL